MGAWRAIKIVSRSNFEHDRPYEREFEGMQKFERISRTHEHLVDLLHVGRNDAARFFYYVMELAEDAQRPVISNQCPVGSESANDAATSSLNTNSLITDYCARTLKLDLERRERLPVEECIELGLALTSALAHLQKHGLDRDIKPSNIIYVNGVPKLADIGLVAGVGEARSYVGTEGFIPPEGPGTAQADIYSLGKVLYESSTGKDRHEFPAPVTNIGESPDQDRLLELNAIIHKACHPEPRERYTSAEEMHADLLLLQRGRSVRRMRVMERRLTVAKRMRLAAALLLVVSGGGFFYQHLQTRRIEREKKIAEGERQISEQLLYAANMSLAQQALEAGHVTRAKALLEMHRPREGRADLRGFEWYHLNYLCRDDPAVTLRGHERGVNGVAFLQTVKWWPRAVLIGPSGCGMFAPKKC